MRAPLSILVATLLVGCGNWPLEHRAAVVQPLPSKYKFDYTVTNASLISLLRVFDDGGSTYFQFRGAPPEEVVISAETVTGNSVIPHEIMGNYAVTRGVYRQCMVASATQPVTVRKLGDIAPMANIGPVLPPKPLPRTETQMAPIPQRAAAIDFGATLDTTHTVRFRRNSARLGPTGRRDLESALADARNATDIEIRVRPFYPNSRASRRLAQARARAIRAELVAKGIADEKIRIESRSNVRALVAELAMRSVNHQAMHRVQRPTSEEMNETGSDRERAIPFSSDAVSVNF